MQPALSHETADLRDPAASVAASSGAAVLIPCYNEELAIGAVVATSGRRCRRRRSTSTTTTPRTNERGRAARPARSCERAPQGKGNVVRRHVRRHRGRRLRAGRRRRHLRRCRAPELVASWSTRTSTWSSAPRRSTDVRPPTGAATRLGNRLLTGLVRDVRRQITDMLSGYRVLSRRFVKSFPALSQRVRDRDRADRARARAAHAGAARSRPTTRSGRRARSASSAPTATAGESSS